MQTGKVNRSIGPLLAAAFLTTLPTDASAGWILSVTVRNVRAIAATGGVTFSTNEANANPGGCIMSDFYDIAATDSPKSALVILLSAKLSGTKVSIYVPDNAPCGGYGRPRVTDVMIGDY